MFAYCNNSPVCMADYNGEDAIYVVILDDDGIPVVGHAMLYIQDADGNWYLTEFAGDRKPDANISLTSTSVMEMVKYLLSGHKKWVYIKGDFSASYELAKQHNGTNYGGYLLNKNNCLHYAKEILLAGSPDSLLYKFAFRHPTIVPMEFYVNLRKARILEVAINRRKKTSKFIQIGAVLSGWLF